MSEIPTRAPADTRAPRPHFEVLEEELGGLQAEYELAGQALEATLDGCDPETVHQIDALDDVYTTVAQDAHERGEDPPLIADFLGDYAFVPEAVINSFQRIETAEAAIAAKEAELNQQAPEKAKAVARQAAELESRLNYDAVADAILDYTAHEVSEELQSIPYKVGLVIATRQLTETEQVPDFAMLKSTEALLKEYQDVWGAHGLLLEDDQEPEVALENPQSLEELAAEIEAAYRETSRLLDRYRSLSRDSRRPLANLTQQIDNLQALYDQKAEPDWFDSYQYRACVANPALRSALVDAVQRAFARLDPNDFELDRRSEAFMQLMEDARNIDVEAALENMDIQGNIEDLPVGMTEDDLKAYLRDHIMPLALASTKRLEFRPLTPEESKEDTVAGFHRYSKELGGSIVVISSTHLQDGAEKLADLDQDIREKVIREAFLRYLSHEMGGHALHEMLPIGMLAFWEEVRASDPVDVTTYVRERYDENHPHRFMEDFADSIMLFNHDPAALHLLSSERFSTISSFYGLLMPAFDRSAHTKATANQLVRWDRNNVDAGAVRLDYVGPDDAEGRPPKNVQEANRR